MAGRNSSRESQPVTTFPIAHAAAVARKAAEAQAAVAPATEVPPPHRPAYIPAVLAGSLGYLLRLAHGRALACAEASLPPNRHPREYSVLVAIAAADAKLSQQRLAERLNINRTIMVGLVDRLEQAGLVSRRRNPADRRSYLLVLTAAGKARLEAMAGGMDAAEQLLSGPLPPEEVERLRTMLVRALFTPDGLSQLPTDLIGRTGFLLFQAHTRISGFTATVLAPLGLTPRHVGALAVIRAGAPCSQQHVAGELGISGPVVVEIVDGLQRRGLVERGPSRIDRRRHELSLTTDGQKVLAAAWDRTIQAAAELTARLDASEASELTALLRKLLTQPAPANHPELQP